MFKIRLLILLSISISLFSCTKNNLNHQSQKYSVAYIGGELDGLILKNILTENLKAFSIYDSSSNYSIQSSVTHSLNLYITNIDNTSDRQNITSTLSTKIIDKRNDCTLYEKSNSVSQFYIFASSDKFLSNQKAEKKIKKDNTEDLVRKLINNLNEVETVCVN
jgi:hypothetical protein